MVRTPVPALAVLTFVPWSIQLLVCAQNKALKVLRMIFTDVLIEGREAYVEPAAFYEMVLSLSPPNIGCLASLYAKKASSIPKPQSDPVNA